MLLGAASLCIALPGLVPMLDGAAHAGIALEERKLPMKFSWVACQRAERLNRLRRPAFPLVRPPDLRMLRRQVWHHRQ